MGSSHHCANDAVNFEQKDEGMHYAINSYIDLQKVVVLNEAVEGSGAKVFKKWEDRLDRTVHVESDVDEELLFNVPFKGHVKITGLVLAGDLDGTHPSHIRLYKDQPSMSFEAVALEADQEFSLKQDISATIDYPMKALKFSNVTHLSLHFPTNFGENKTRIYYIGLRGEYVADIRQQICITTYEARPMLKDHKGEIPDVIQRDIMDRLTWYQPGDYMEDIIIQSGHVGIYDGDVKQTTYEQGTASLTLHRIIWADSNDPDHRLILHHSLVAGIEKHHKSMFRRGGKIILSLHPKPLGQQQGPFASSSFNYIRLVFRNGGEDEFFEKYKEALKMNTWERVPSNCATSGLVALRSCNTMMPRAVGILGIEKRLIENHHRTHESISQAFEDMNRLMEYAREMVSLSKSITDKLRSRKGEITDDETVRFKTYLLSLGVSDPVTKSAFGSSAEYYKKLAEELAAVLCTPLKECGGMMTLSDVYCRINRARGLELLSPEDILNACQMLEQMNLPISLNRFESGVMVVQLKEMSVETTIESTAELVAVMGTCNANKLAKCLGITVILAKERLLAAEAQARLCRDDTVEGLMFYPNHFMTSC